METDRLKYFCAIVDAGSLTKASELMGISHSGLSKSMTVLQNELGFKIFTPKGRGLELTEQGKMLYEQSRKILEMLESLKNHTRILQKVVHIALPEAIALVTSEALARDFREGITIEDLDSGEIEARILDRRLDFAFTFVPFPHKEIDHLKIGTVALTSFCRTGSFEGLDPEKIPYVVPSTELRDNPLSLRIRDGWNPNLPRFTLYRANSLSIALKMVQAGACAAYAPKFLISFLNESEPKNRQLVELDLPAPRRIKEKTHRDIFLVKRHTDEESKVMKAVVKIIRQICKDR